MCGPWQCQRWSCSECRKLFWDRGNLNGARKNVKTMLQNRDRNIRIGGLSVRCCYRRNRADTWLLDVQIRVRAETQRFKAQHWFAVNYRPVLICSNYFNAIKPHRIRNRLIKNSVYVTESTLFPLQRPTRLMMLRKITANFCWDHLKRIYAPCRQNARFFYC
jgi:hypothetical protein